MAFRSAGHASVAVSSQRGTLGTTAQRMYSSMQWNVSVTPTAVQRLQEAAAAQGVTPRLRVAIEGGGCSGFRYRFSFDEELSEDDQSVAFGGVELVTDPVSRCYLEGAELDYGEGLSGAQFEWRNPQARRTCGCGQSFEA